MSGKQWAGTAIVLATIIGVELCSVWMHRYAEQHDTTQTLQLRPELEQVFAHYMDSVRQAEYEARYPRRHRYDNHLPPLPFDPNIADSAMLVRSGMPPWMARNILRYRHAGKVFRQADELQRVYGMNDSLFARLQPYILIDTLYADSLFQAHRSERRGMDTISMDSLRADYAFHSKKDTIIDLNTADTASLQLIRGIGIYTAIRILQYRQALGGYVFPEQLREIHEIPPTRTDSLIPHFVADTMLVTPIAVNKASVKRLQRHPYISYKQAEQLYDLRRRKIQLHSLDELAPVFTEEERRKLAPYLSFDE